MKTIKTDLAGVVILILGLSTNLIAGSHGGHGTHWGYEGETGPDNWGYSF